MEVPPPLQHRGLARPEDEGHVKRRSKSSGQRAIPDGMERWVNMPERGLVLGETTSPKRAGGMARDPATVREQCEGEICTLETHVANSNGEGCVGKGVTSAVSPISSRKPRTSLLERSFAAPSGSP